jgi:hypothetical protein
MYNNVLEIKAARTLPDTTGPEPRTRSVRGARVKGGADEGDVEFLVFTGEARVVWETAEGGDSREDGVCLLFEKNC